MKKYLFLLGVVLFGALAARAEVFANDYEFQKQLLINGRETCQAVRIHESWFLTSAHCVAKCKTGACDLRLILAQNDDVQVSAALTSADIFIPQEYQTVTEQGVRTHTGWDISLLRFTPGEYHYRYADGADAPQSAFQQALTDEEFAAQWQGITRPKLPFLYTYSSESTRQINTRLVVPRWQLGVMTSLSAPKYILYFGSKQATWGSAGFGVEEGNSGGGVFLDKSGLLGIVTAKRTNDLPAEIKQKYPQFGVAEEFFFFNGFSKKTTFKFIKDTLTRFGAHVKTKELKQILQVQSAPQP